MATEKPEAAEEVFSKYPEVDREFKLAFTYLQLLEKALKSIETDFDTHMSRIKMLVHFRERFEKLAALEEEEIERQQEPEIERQGNVHE